ncbi:hypothetical protein ACFQVA_24845 [Actinomadura keratinilytica]
MWTQGVGMNGGAPVPEQRSVSGGVPEQPPGPDSERIAPAKEGTGSADAPAARGSAMRYAVLGPVRAWRGGDRLAPGTPQQQALLAVLLLREGRTATAPELIDALWGEEPPRRRSRRSARTPPGCGRSSTPATSPASPAATRSPCRTVPWT